MLIHYEITSYCNAKCPGCTRTKMDDLVPTHLSVEHIKKSITSDLTSVLLCGNLGDPMMHPNLDEILDLFDVSTQIQINTNGSIRTPDWYTEAAKRKNLTIEFSIDGLEDRNDIYRIGVEWNKVMANAKAFIDAGGTARWAFIMFNHNEHQVDEVKTLAKEMGFKIFREKRSERSLTLQPTSPDIIHPQYVYETPEMEINCDYYDDNSFYISATGDVNICCWNDISKGSCNLHDIEWNEVLQYWIDKDAELQRTWLERTDERCVEMCGTKYSKTIKTNYAI